MYGLRIYGNKVVKEFMKRLYLIPLLFLSFFLTSCAPSGDFVGTKAVIIHKEQSSVEKEKKQAEYTIYFDSPLYSNLKLIFPEDFGEVGYIIVGEKGGKLVAKPRLVEEENK